MRPLDAAGRLAWRSQLIRPNKLASQSPALRHIRHAPLPAEAEGAMLYLNKVIVIAMSLHYKSAIAWSGVAGGCAGALETHSTHATE